MQRQPSEDLEITLKKIYDLDLSGVNAKLTADPADEGKGWSQARAEFVERQYRNWLFVAYKYERPDRVIVPTRELDEFWHSHILDTRAYARDMEAIFGGFRHHNPYMGVGGDDALLALCDAYDITAELYQTEFHEPFVEYD